MRHILLIDPIEKLNIKKDSSLMLALALKKRGIETYILFERDFVITNAKGVELNLYDFEGSLKEDQIYLNSFKVTSSKKVSLYQNDTIHMRLDPPFDSRYLRVLWMLDHLNEKGIKILNNPRGIMNFNEKLYAYRNEGAIPSFVGANLALAQQFVDGLDSSVSELILKPMDLYSGIGVEKVARNSFTKRFSEKVGELSGPIIIQPFMEGVKKGEVRSIFFKGIELGSILKIPKDGEFLSNIAQGATFKAHELSALARSRVNAINKELARFGVDWVAYDILEDSVSEVNITCPGLLVEVSFAYKKNLADMIIDLL